MENKGGIHVGMPYNSLRVEIDAGAAADEAEASA